MKKSHSSSDIRLGKLISSHATNDSVLTKKTLTPNHTYMAKYRAIVAIPFPPHLHLQNINPKVANKFTKILRNKGEIQQLCVYDWG